MQSESTTASCSTGGSLDVVDVTQASLNRAIREYESRVKQYRLSYMALERALWDAATQLGRRSASHRLVTQQGDTGPEMAYYRKELATIGVFQCVEFRGHPTSGCNCKYVPVPKHRDSYYWQALDNTGCVRFVIVCYDDDVAVVRNVTVSIKDFPSKYSGV